MAVQIRVETRCHKSIIAVCLHVSNSVNVTHRAAEPCPTTSLAHIASQASLCFSTIHRGERNGLNLSGTLVGQGQLHPLIRRGTLRLCERMNAKTTEFERKGKCTFAFLTLSNVAMAVQIWW